MMKERRRFGSSMGVLSAALAILAGCGSGAGHPEEGVPELGSTVSRPAPYSVRAKKETRFAPEDEKRLRELCPWGIPRLDPHWAFGPTEVVVRDGYVLEHSSKDKIPVWVCEHVTRERVTGKAERSNKFQEDPLLRGPKSTNEDYRGTGYDRGHQAPAGDFAADQRLQDESFMLSNMAPQLPGLNRNIWKDLEETVRKWALESGELWVITGGIFYDPKEEDSGKATGVVDHKVIGKGVAVPTHFYKIVVRKGKDGTLEAIAFLMENKASFPKPYQFEKYIRSIRWIEEHSGIDFEPDLDKGQQDAMEQATPSLWSHHN